MPMCNTCNIKTKVALCEKAKEAVHICKECCFRDNGHKCAWWNLCW